MAKINLKQATVEFPIYNINARSFKKQFIRAATGGNVAEDANEHIVVKALQNITLSLADGDRIGLIGHNGSGKSTFLRLLAQIYEPTYGQISVQGHISPMLDLMHGIEVELTGHENIISRGLILGLTRQQIKTKIDEIGEFSGLGDYLAMPLRTYSSGMMVRLAFAITTSIDPEILLIDEIFGAGDADFMQRARHKMVSLLNQSSIVVMATHADDLIKEFCNKTLLLEGGKIKYFGPTEEGLDIYHGRRNY